MNQKSKLKAFFSSEKEDKRKIDEFEKYKSYFNDLINNGLKQDIEFAISIKLYDYAAPLSRTGYYKKCLTVLTELDTEIEKHRGLLDRYKYYREGHDFLKGLCLGRLKKYNESNVEFTKLLKIHPDNDNYIDWYKSNKKKEIYRFTERLGTFGAILFVIVLIAQLSGVKISILVLYAAAIISLTSWLLGYLIPKIIDKQSVNIDKTTT